MNMKKKQYKNFQKDLAKGYMNNLKCMVVFRKNSSLSYTKEDICCVNRDAWCYKTDNTTTARIQINSFREMFFVVF